MSTTNQRDKFINRIKIGLLLECVDGQAGKCKRFQCKVHSNPQRHTGAAVLIGDGH